MATVEYDLKELLAELKKEFATIHAKLDKMDTKIAKVAEDVSTIKLDLQRGELELKNEITIVELGLKFPFNYFPQRAGRKVMYL